MFPIRPKPDDPRPLTDLAHPAGWENLGGPLSWFETLENPQLEEHDEYGLALRVRVKNNDVGILARKVNELGRFPAKVYLFSGPGGTGKTMAEELFARTHLSPRLEPVSYPTDQGDVTLIDHETGEPFLLNPVEEGMGKRKYTREAINNPSVDPEQAARGATGSMKIQAYNAGQLYKKHIDALVDTTRWKGALGKAERVIIISEIDNLSKKQVPSIKMGLNPGSLPDGVVVFADTNHLDAVRSAMGEAGLQRFEIIRVNRWTPEELAEYATKWIEHFGIEFDLDSFKTAEAADDPIDMIVKRADGAIRTLVVVMDQLRGASDAINYKELAKLLTENQQSVGFEVGACVWRFVNRSKNQRKTSYADVAYFVGDMIKRQMGYTSFVNSLNAWFLENRKYLTEDVSLALWRLTDNIGYVGEPAREAIWGSAIYSLRSIAQSLANHK